MSKAQGPARSSRSSESSVARPCPYCENVVEEGTIVILEGLRPWPSRFSWDDMAVCPHCQKILGIIG